MKALVYLCLVLGGAVGSATLAASYPDLVLDSDKRMLKVEYLPHGAAPEVVFYLYQEKDGKESLIQTLTAPVQRGQRTRIEFRVPAIMNCVYRVEVRDGTTATSEVMILYNPRHRTPEKSAQVSGLLDIPVALIGRFLEKYVSTLMHPQGQAIWRLDVESKQLERVLSITDSKIAEVAPAPDGMTIAYVRVTTDHPSGELWLGYPGAEATNVAAGHSPVWSNDRRSLYFVEQGRLKRFDLSSRDIKTVRNEAEPVFELLLGRPGGTPSRLLAVSRIGSESWQIWLVDPTTAEAEPISYDAAYLWLPNLSPQRDRLVHAEYRGVGSGSHIIIEALAGGRTAVTEGTWEDTAPAWSADGASVYFVSNRR